GAGARIAQRLGGGYLSRVLGYTVGPTTVNQIEQAIETGQLPDPKHVGIDAFKNAVFAFGFGVMHGGQSSRARPEAVSESLVTPERSEPIRTTPGLDWAASNERTGHGILDGIQRIAGGYSGPVDVPLGSEFRPASGLSPTTGESRPSHKDV